VNIKIIGLGVCFLIIFSSTASAGDLKELAEGLLSEKVEIREHARKELLTNLMEAKGVLIQIVSNVENQRRKEDSVSQAIFILGEMRSVEAIEALVSNIGFPVVSRESDPDVPRHVGMGDFGKPLPAVDALIKIGEPCLIRIIKKIGEADHVTEHKACLRVLLALKGRETTEAMMKDALEKETDARKRTRRKNSLIMLSQMK
jgi:hypothetical protein